MNAIDLLSLAYIGFSVGRGRKRGLGDESFRLFRLGVALGAGCGLYGLVSGALGKILSLAPVIAGPVSFVGTMAGAWFLLRALRRRMTEWVAARFAPWQATGGMIAGGLRALVVALSVLATGLLAGGDGLVAQAWLGRLAGWLVR